MSEKPFVWHGTWDEFNEQAAARWAGKPVIAHIATDAPRLPKIHAHPDDQAEEWLAGEFEPDDSGIGVSYERENMIDAFRGGWDRARELIAAQAERDAPVPGEADGLREELAALRDRAEDLRTALDGLTDRAAAGGIITEDEAAEYRKVVGPGETLREELAVLRERLGNLAAGLELSASTSLPSKKSEIEQGCARAVRGIAEGR